MKNISLLLFLSLSILACETQDSKLESAKSTFDKRTNQKPITQYSEVLTVLGKFKKISYNSLPSWYKKMMDPEDKFTAQLKSKYWMEIKGDEIFYYLAGTYRVMDFLPEDSLYRENINKLPDGITQYLLLDPRVVKKFLMLKDELKKGGYDDNAMKITNGYRYPAFNKKEGGASHSRHIWGEAMDMDILDINKSGKADSIDKKIVLDLLDRKIIGNEGGVGRYPGTDGVHLDVRGFRARWDSY